MEILRKLFGIRKKKDGDRLEETVRSEMNALGAQYRAGSLSPKDAQKFEEGLDALRKRCKRETDVRKERPA